MHLQALCLVLWKASKFRFLPFPSLLSITNDNKFSLGYYPYCFTHLTLLSRHGTTHTVDASLWTIVMVFIFKKFKSPQCHRVLEYLLPTQTSRKDGKVQILTLCSTLLPTQTSLASIGESTYTYLLYMIEVIYYSFRVLADSFIEQVCQHKWCRCTKACVILSRWHDGILVQIQQWRTSCKNVVSMQYSLIKNSMPH